MESCLADISHQTRLYEEQTGLKTVTTTCVADAPVVTVTQYFLKIEGFEKNGKYSNSRPQKYLYTFAPLAFEDLADTRQAEFGQFLASFDATIVKQSPGLFVYYRAGGPLPLNAEIKAYYRNQNECESQIEHVYTLYTNAGSQKIISWCREGRLQVLYDGSFYLSQIPGVNNTEYATLDQCLADQEFVLADSRNSHAVGALCAPNMYNSAVYSMILYRKGW